MDEHAIFLAAVEMKDQAVRLAYLDSACGNNSGLRARLDELLRLRDISSVPTASPQITKVHNPDAPAETQDPLLDDVDAALEFLLPSAKPGSLGQLSHYEVIEFLGKGAFGTVLKAFDEMLHRMVAIKVMSSAMAITSPARKRFLREARASAAIRHENIVTIYSVHDQPFPYLVMEYIPGLTLQKQLDLHGPLEAVEVLRLGRQIASGLAAAHAQGLIHRDIKPANILLESGPSLVAKITDFGLARAADDASVTQSGVIAGTPMYMSPEQAHGGHIDQRTDLFSLGSVLYQMVSGRPPFRASTTLGVLKRVTEETPRPIREIIPEVPDWLCQIISKLHAKQPDERFQTAKEVAELLEKHLAEWGKKVPRTSVAGVRRPLATSNPDDPAQTKNEADLVLSAATVQETVSASRDLFATAEPRLIAAPTERSDSNVLPATEPHQSKQKASWLLVCLAATSLIAVVSGSLYFQIGTSDPKPHPVVEKQKAPTAGDLVLTTNLASTTVAPQSSEPPPLDEVWIKKVQALPAEKQAQEVAAELQRRNPGFDGKHQHIAENNVVLRFEVSTSKVKDISPIRALSGLVDLICTGSPAEHGILEDLRPLAGLPLTRVICQRNHIADISPLRNMQLVFLDAAFNPIKDLTPIQNQPVNDLLLHGTHITELTALHGMPLTSLGFDGTAVTDLSPLKGMPLADLSFELAHVEDLRPLENMPLHLLNCHGTKVVDFSPLQRTPVQTLICDVDLKRDAESLRAIKSLATINGVAAAEFLRSPPTVPVAALSPEWIKRVEVLKGDEQIKEVIAELQRRNPRFNEQSAEFKTRDGVVEELKIVTDHVEDISPIRAFPDLLTFYCTGSLAFKGRLVDISPLKEMELDWVSVANNQITDLTPLSGMHLKGLVIDNNPISDLSALANGKLERIYFTGTKVADGSVLKGMPLECVHMDGSLVNDTTFLKSLPLRVVALEIKDARDLSRLRSIRTLKTINDQPAAEFWKAQGYGPFLPLDPEWVKKVQAMKIEDQVQEVGAELRRRNRIFDGQVSHQTEDGKITGIELISDKITDISPVSALTDLKELKCKGSAPGVNTALVDLSPLKDLKLERIEIDNTRVCDLWPLSDMPLATVHCAHTAVSDLSPLGDKKLRTLVCSHTQVSDLVPLEHSELTHLECDHTSVTNLAPLKNLPLTILSHDFVRERDEALLKSIQTLTTVNGKPAAELSHE